MDDLEQQAGLADPVNELENFFNLSFDSVGLDQLKQIALWAKVCSIAALCAYVIQLYLWLFGHSQFSVFLGGGVFEIVFKLVFIGGGGTVNWLLYRFAAAVSRGVENSDVLYLNSGFSRLRLYFKTAGILVIIAICLIVLAILVNLISYLQNVQ